MLEDNAGFKWSALVDRRYLSVQVSHGGRERLAQCAKSAYTF